MTRDFTESMIRASDLEGAADVAITQLASLPSDSWSMRAANVDWSCHDTVAHLVDVLVGYSMCLASALPGPWPALRCHVPASDRLSALRCSAALLAFVASKTPPDVRGFHAAGPADAEGFLAMAINEILVHTADVATAGGSSFDPPTGLAVAVLDRLFPWWPRAEDPGKALAWANGRTALSDLPNPGSQWLWHSRPVAEWDGSVPIWRPSDT